MGTIRTTGEARRKWQAAQAAWRAEGERLIADVASIEDPKVRHAVGGILDIVGSGYGAVNIAFLPDGRLRSRNLDLDLEANRALANAVGGEEVIEEALTWIRKRLHGRTVMTIAFLFGTLREEELPPGSPVLPKAEFDAEGFVYDMLQKRITGVRMNDGRVWRPPR